MAPPLRGVMVSPFHDAREVSVSAARASTAKLYVEVIKPSHYDDDGYVIQWRRAFIPSNSLA